VADDLATAFLAGAVAALRKRGAVLRRKAAPGVTVLDSIVTIIASESAISLRLARDFENLAAELEREAGR
jgi:hypothetical protein